MDTTKNSLAEIMGVGPAAQAGAFKHFRLTRGVSNTSVKDPIKEGGVNRALAARYSSFIRKEGRGAGAAAPQPTVVSSQAAKSSVPPSPEETL